MNYQELLRTEEWKHFNYKILERDSFTCQECNSKGFVNNLYIPISSINEALDDMFKDYSFDGRLLRDIIEGIPKKFHLKLKFKPVDRYKNIYSTNFSVTTILNFNLNNVNIYDDVKLYSESLLPEEICFTYQRLMYYALQKNNEPVSSYVFVNVARFPKYDNSNNGYMMVNTEQGKSEVAIITNEYYISITILHADSHVLQLFPKLNVHHTFYIYGKVVPWGYNFKDLTTLCQKCHKHLHETTDVPILNYDLSPICNESLNECDRCGGTGFLPQYSHVEGGICFKCRGTKKAFFL